MGNAEQENLISEPVGAQGTEEIATRLVPSQAASDEIAELEKKYREILERENR